MREGTMSDGFGSQLWWSGTILETGDEVMALRIKTQPLARHIYQAHPYRTDRQQSWPVHEHR
ncbi:hypothetical protein AOC05_03255 [Arthrobacter alpinus]|uniref:Uncharacterized protein n=2 Tax=Arthrobacter TaxID=1663 RepID=A0A0M5LXA8_9MICC|nr:hypothetical protein AOC05_03255 [Arthrobacter alpinus]